jgi:hypothetical protein
LTGFEIVRKSPDKTRMKITSITCLFLTVALNIECRPARAAETNSVPRVGTLREFDRFLFQGNSSFSASNLWSGLNGTFDFPELSHPLAPRDAFLAAIGSHLRLGYVHCGFPDARIAAHYDGQANCVVVQIKEGPRYRCGPVEVIGARKLPPRPIVEALTVTNAGTDALSLPFKFLDNAPANRTEAAETNSSKIWVAGQPAHFDDISLQYLSGKVTNTLAKHGFFLSRFTLSILTNATVGTATLQVKILDEGPPATLSRINVTGNRRNSREALLDYLGLKPGIAFTSDLAAAINDRLYHSARFLTNTVRAGTPDSAGRLKLTLEVVENDECPPLKGQFDRMEQTVLLTRDWLAKLGDTGEEAVLSLTGYSDPPATAQFILAPRQGLLVLETGMVSGTNRLRHALILSSSQVALYAPDRQEKFATNFLTGQFQSYITVETGAPGPDGHSANLMAGAGLTPLADATGAPPCALSLSLAPAAFVRLAHRTNSTRWFDGDQLICSNAEYVLKLDARTGRFIEMTTKDPEPPRIQSSLHFEPDAFASALARIERDGAGFVNVCGTNPPLSSGITFFGGELVQLPLVDAFLRARLPANTCAQLPTLLRRLGAEDFLSPFESFIDIQKAPAGDFEILEGPRPVMGGTFGAELTVAAQWVLKGGDLIFPPRSWPSTFLRDLALLSRNQQRYLQADMAEIFGSDDTGPIACLAAAGLLQCLGSPTANMAAARGLQRLSADAFRDDCRLFLDERYVAGQFAARLAAALGALNEPELEALVAPMPAARAEFIRDCARRLRAAPNGQPVFATIAPALDTSWEKGLKQNVAKALRKIANQ